MKIVIITTVCNAARYIERCLESIRVQDVRDWTCYVCDDLSTDGTAEKLDAVNDRRFIVTHNRQKLFVAGNYHQVLIRPEIHDDDICITVDGDDWLPDPGVFGRIVAAYREGDSWITWGSYLEFNGKEYCPGVFSQPVQDVTTLRDKQWRTSHLRTFLAFLFRHIQVRDLQRNGEFYSSCGDLAMMFPMLEMAGNAHARFLPSINYLYNSTNPLCEFRVSSSHREDELHIRSLPRYPILDRPPLNTVLASSGRDHEPRISQGFSKIPKIIHQIWIGNAYPRPQVWMDSWRRMNPTWEHYIWTEAEIDRFGLRNRAQYEAVGRPDTKADVVRYELLFRYGGFFVDADTECIKSLDDELCNYDSFACFENEINEPGVISNGYLGATLGNELMRLLVEGIAAYDPEKFRTNDGLFLWRHFGPGYLTDMVHKYAYHKLRVFPSYYFIPRHCCGDCCYWPHASPVYSRQFWGTTTGTYPLCPQGELEPLDSPKSHIVNQPERYLSDSRQHSPGEF